MIANPTQSDLSGQTFFYLTAIRPTEQHFNGVIWLFRCKCGGERLATMSRVKRGAVKSCGCRIHGMAKTPEFRAWHNMKDRCNNSRHKQFPYYGGRGITVCSQWNEPGGFLNFIADMGPRPSPQHTLERVNNEQGYNPQNCEWKTMYEQNRNKRDSRKITYDGTTANLADWATVLEISIQALRWRLSHWPIEKTMTAPLRHRSPNRRGMK